MHSQTREGWDLMSLPGHRRGRQRSGRGVRRLSKPVSRESLYDDDEASLQFVRFLVASGADREQGRRRYGRNALYFACNSGGQFGLDVVRLIIDAGANIDAKTTRARAGEVYLSAETPCLSTAIALSFAPLGYER